MASEKIKEYTNGEITVVWKPEKCFHAKKCIHELPNVYKPTERPWIQVDNATTEQLQHQVKTCPSGALTYYMNDEAQQEPLIEEKTQITVMQNGPLIVTGDCEIENVDGGKTTRESKTAFCRCGASSNKPFCDGTHHKINFQG